MDLFFQSAELTSIYWRMVFELYDPPGNTIQISDTMRKRFKRVVQNADLCSPLQTNILETAKKNLGTRVPTKFSSLVEKAKAPLKEEKILSIKQEDIGKFSKEKVKNDGRIKSKTA